MRRKEQVEVEKCKYQETDEEEKEKEVKQDKKMEGIPKVKRKMTEIEWDGAGASDEKNPAKVAKEMQTGFGRAEEEEMDKENLCEAKRSFEAEFGGDDAEEYLARTRTMSEEVSLVSSSGPPYFDAVTGEQLPEDLVEKGMKVERESLEKFPVYEEVPDTEVKEVGGKLIKSRWVFNRISEDHVKGRIVAQRLNLGVGGHFRGHTYVAGTASPHEDRVREGLRVEARRHLMRVSVRAPAAGGEAVPPAPGE